MKLFSWEGNIKMFRKNNITNKAMKTSIKTREHNFIIMLSIVIASTILIIGAMTINTFMKSKQEKQWNVNEKITTDKFEISVEAIEKRSQVGSGVFESRPAEDWVYLTVFWNWKNISKRALNSVEIPTIQVIDNSGTKYDADLEASMSLATESNLDTQTFSDLKPGIKISDSIVFEVSNEMLQTGEYKLQINTDKNLVLEIPSELVKDASESQQPTDSKDISNIGTPIDKNDTSLIDNSSNNFKEEDDSPSNNELIDIKEEAKKLTWDPTMGMNYSISEVNLSKQGGTIQFVIGRDTPNGTKVIAIWDNQGVNILREISTFPSAAFDEWGELKEGYKIEACFHDLDGDGDSEMLLAIGDGISNLGVSVIKVKRDENLIDYYEIGYIEGQDKIIIKPDNKILVPFGEGIFKKYEVKGDYLLKVY